MNSLESGPGLPFDESLDLTKCISNSLGLIKMGTASAAEIDELIERRIDVGKRGRNRFGRLVCEAEGCSAICNVELVDGKPVERDMTQAFKLFDECIVMQACIER